MAGGAGNDTFIVDSSKIANALHVEATPIEQAMAETLAAYDGRPAQAPR